MYALVGAQKFTLFTSDRFLSLCHGETWFIVSSDAALP